ncbi:MAG: hypothetical protein V1855_00635 [bacterium]
MSNNRRQQKLAKRKARSKAKQKQTRQANNFGTNAHYIKDALKNPIFECLIDNSSANGGMRHLIVSKMSGTNVVVLGAFLLDTYCLGIKNTFIQPGSMEQYRALKSQRPYDEIDPGDAKKLLLDMIDWSRNIGFEPHKDFKKAFKVFDGVNAEDSMAIFEFGKDGKPFFVAGPHDTPAMCSRVLKTLEKSCGTVGEAFHYMMPDFSDDILAEDEAF